MSEETQFIINSMAVVVIVSIGILLIMLSVTRKGYRQIKKLQQQLNTAHCEIELLGNTTKGNEVVIRSIIERYFADLYERFRAQDPSASIFYTAHMKLNINELKWLHAIYLKSIGLAAEELESEGVPNIPLSKQLVLFEDLFMGKDVYQAYLSSIKDLPPEAGLINSTSEKRL